MSPRGSYHEGANVGAGSSAYRTNHAHHNTSLKVRIEGHTDSVGSKAINVKLSQGRADAVKEFLAGQGVETARLSSQGFGPEVPLDTNANAEGRVLLSVQSFDVVELGIHRVHDIASSSTHESQKHVDRAGAPAGATDRFSFQRFYD